MARIGADDVTRRWRQQTDPCQLPLPAAAAKKQIWDGMEEVFHTD
ncbi:MAG: L-rhamnose mutarotase [Kiritimatiellaeota bacterium]|nr:L-rhamnose mutarotase [Kiritimatiellota bacterium]